MSRGIISMDEALARGPIEQAYSGGVGLSGGGARRLAHALEGGPQLRALGAIAQRAAARLTHRLLGGLDSRQNGLLVRRGRYGVSAERSRRYDIDRGPADSLS